MKKIVSGVLCDTSTARLLGEYEHEFRSSFHWYMERLYRTKSGKFFIYGEGYAASPYARKVSTNEWAPGERIKLISPEAARRWAEENLDGDEYIAAFGEPDEDGEHISVAISVKTKAVLDDLKSRTGKTLRQLIEEAVAEYDKRQGE